MTKDRGVNDPRLAEAIDSYNAGNWPRALSLLLSMADDGITAAYPRIGFIYEYGYNGRYGRDRGVRQDLDKALEWYGKAHSSGQISGTVGLARIYFGGYGVHRDYGKSFHYLSLARRHRIPEVYRSLGVLYDTGNGVPQDKRKAKIMYMRAAVKGDKTAFAPIGAILIKTEHRKRGYWLMLYGLLQSFRLILRGRQRCVSL